MLENKVSLINQHIKTFMISQMRPEVVNSKTQREQQTKHNTTSYPFVMQIIYNTCTNIV